MPVSDPHKIPTGPPPFLPPRENSNPAPPAPVAFPFSFRNVPAPKVPAAAPASTITHIYRLVIKGPEVASVRGPQQANFLSRAARDAFVERIEDTPYLAGMFMMHDEDVAVKSIEEWRDKAGHLEFLVQFGMNADQMLERLIALARPWIPERMCAVVLNPFESTLFRSEKIAWTLIEKAYTLVAATDKGKKFVDLCQKRYLGFPINVAIGLVGMKVVAPHEYDLFPDPRIHTPVSEPEIVENFKRHFVVAFDNIPALK